jgi:hypothetical protein
VQLDADTQGPIPSIQLQRNLTEQTVSNGIYLKGLINTVYNIDIQREDKG